MIPPIFPIAAGAPAVTALLGLSPVRFFPFGEAPQRVQKPYAVWQTIGGTPENKLACAPDADSYSVQMDVYGASAASVLAVAQALRDAFEPHGYITNWGGEDRDPDTNNYRFSFDFDIITNR